jgi:hypothetical protein
MSTYIVAKENFREAANHVSPEKDPVMFNLLYGLLSLAEQIEKDLESLRPQTPVRPSRKTKKVAPLKKKRKSKRGRR